MFPHLNYAVQASFPYLQKDIKLIERMQRLATRCVKNFRRLPYPERLHELKLPSMERHFLRVTLITVCKLFHGYLNLSAEEFLEPQAASYLREHNLKVRQTSLHLARLKTGFCCTFDRTVEQTASTHRWSSDSVQFQGSLGCQLVLHLPWHCLTLSHSLFLCKWFWRASAIVKTSKLNLIWYSR